MTTDDTEDRSGSVPHRFRNALFWRWAPSMPRELKGTFLTMLYALASGADAAGRLRFSTGKLIKADVLARAAGCDVKDGRRYLAAAEAAGVVIVEGRRGRGRTTAYALGMHPNPDWAAAVKSLEDSKRDRPERTPGWNKKGGPPPEPESPNLGGPPPELQQESANEEGGTAPRIGSGDRPPIGSGDRPPNEPGSIHEVLHEAASGGGNPHVARASPPRRTPIQPPLMTSVPTVPPADAGEPPGGLTEYQRIRAAEQQRLGVRPPLPDRERRPAS